MEQVNPNNKSGFKSHIWREKQPEWDITSDLWKSPLHIRNEGKEYLEQGNAEPDLKYEQRKNRSVINNFFRDTIERFGGMVFKSDPQPDGVSKDIKDLFTDIDLCGNSLHKFCINGFELHLRDGNGFIVVDAPQFEATGETVTLQDRANDRPYWTFYEAEQLINHSYTKVNGRTVLARVTIETCSYEDDGDFGEKEVIRHLILRRGSFEVRKFATKADIDKDIYELEVPETLTGIEDIQIVPISEIGNTPPFLGMAMLNLQHYNQTSDFDNAIYMSNNPEKVFKFDTEDDARKFKDLNKKDTSSSAIAKLIFGQNADAKYLEITGAGLTVAKDRINDLAGQIAKIGIGMLSPSEVAPKTATEVMDSAGQRQSRLAKFTRDFENAIEKALYLTAELYNAIKGSKLIDLKISEDAEIKLKIDYDRLTVSPEKLTILQTEVEAGRISYQTYLEMLSQAVELPTTPEEELLRLQAEKGTKSDVENVIVLNNMTLGEMQARANLANSLEGIATTAQQMEIVFGKVDNNALAQIASEQGAKDMGMLQ